MNKNSRRVTGRELLFHALLLLAMLVCLFPGTFLRGERTAPGALLYEQAPWKHYRPADLVSVKNSNTSEYLSFFAKLHAAEHMAHENGEWPLWNPLELTGTPLLANYQSAVFFPLRIPHWFLEPLLADTIFLLLRLWFCGLTTYVCARGFGLDIGPARFFSLAWMMSGICINWFYWPLPEVMASLPLVLLGAEYLATARNRKGFATLTLGAVLILLTGHPETAFMGCLGVGIYFLLRVALSRSTQARITRLALAGGAWVFALVVCAPQILPFFEYIAHSSITIGSYEHTISKYSGLPLQTLACLLVPRFFGISADGNFWLDDADNSNTTAFLYIGAVTWAALALLFARGKRSSNTRAQVTALTVSALLGIFLALRSHPVTALSNLPVWQYWYATFPLFALPLLGALGLEHWFSHKRTLRDAAVPLVVTAIPFLFAAVLFLFHKQVLTMQDIDDYVLRQILYAAGFAGFGIVIAAGACIRIPARALTSLLALLLAVDLIFASRDLLPTTPGNYLFPETRLTSELQAKGHPVRISALTGGIDSGLLQHYRIEQLHGYDALFPRRIVEYMGETYPGAWEQAERLCSLEYYLFPQDVHADNDQAQGMEFISSVDGIDIFRNPRALPRAFLVPSLERLPDSTALFTRMHDEAFDPAKVALTDARIEPFASEPVPESPGTAHIEAWSTTTVAVRLDVSVRSVLVLTDAFYPGWNAYVDGTKAEVFPIYHNFRGVIVEPGDSNIEFRFEPASLRLGLWISCITLVLMFLWAVWTLRRRRSRRTCAP